MTAMGGLAVAALLLSVAPPVASQAVAAASIPDDHVERAARAEHTLDLLFRNPEGRRVVHLNAAAVDSVGDAMSSRNMHRVAEVDSAYVAGRFGPVGDSRSKADALAAYIYGAETAFDFFLQLALQDSVIYSTSEEDLRLAFTKRFRNPGLYPIVNLVDARAGLGHFALQFEVDDPAKRELMISKDKMKAWTEEIEYLGERFRVVNIDMKTISNDRVHVVYRRFSCGEVRAYDTDEGGVPVRVVALEDLNGQFVRKYGFHRPAAMVLWKTRTEGIAAPPEGARYLGTAVYFPGLKLQLPWFLPDLGFDDLRRFDFPEPILTMDAVRDLRDRNLDWIRVRDDLRFGDWEGQGSVPDFVSTHFPDR